jgi:metal-dependent amidase/aminoacylase/carboxypeptidase family protein
MHPNAGDLEELYKDVHRHPELSMQEQRTAGLAAERRSAAGTSPATWSRRACRSTTCSSSWSS